MTDTRSRSSAPQHCARCGAEFRCGQQAGDKTCWCVSMPALPADRLNPGLTCLCSACLSEEVDQIGGK